MKFAIKEGKEQEAKTEFDKLKQEFDDPNGRFHNTNQKWKEIEKLKDIYIDKSCYEFLPLYKKDLN
ncbi:MAG: hypothetical protein NC222_06425 [Staphylococcus sp.]|nr:hypothetical protein [Staphylococcus sp.]